MLVKLFISTFRIKIYLLMKVLTSHLYTPPVFSCSPQSSSNVESSRTMAPHCVSLGTCFKSLDTTNSSLGQYLQTENASDPPVRGEMSRTIIKPSFMFMFIYSFYLLQPLQNTILFTYFQLNYLIKIDLVSIRS